MPATSSRMDAISVWDLGAERSFACTVGNETDRKQSGPADAVGEFGIGKDGHDRTPRKGETMATDDVSGAALPSWASDMSHGVMGRVVGRCAAAQRLQTVTGHVSLPIYMRFTALGAPANRPEESRRLE